MKIKALQCKGYIESIELSRKSVERKARVQLPYLKSGSDEGFRGNFLATPCSSLGYWVG